MARLSCADRLIREAKQLAQIDPNDFGAIRTFIERTEAERVAPKPSLSKKGMEVLYNSMLSGITTQVAILMETPLVNVMHTAEKGLASGVGAIRGLLTGNKERVKAEDVGSRAAGMLYSVNDRSYGIMASTQELASLWWKNFRLAHEAGAELSPSHPVRSVIGTHPDDTYVEQIIGKIVRVPSSLIAGTDAMVQELGKRASIWEQASIAYRRAGEPGNRAEFIDNFVRDPNKWALSQRQVEALRERYNRGLALGLVDGTEEEYINNFANRLVKERAKIEGQKANFTTPPSVLVKNIIELVDKVPFGRVLMPFINTPANIFKWVAERVPGLGLLFKESQRELLGGKTFMETLRRLPPDQLSAIKEYSGMDFDNVIARQTLGTSIVVAAMWLNANGYISAGPSLDSEKRVTQQEAGNQTYAFRVGDKMYSYTRPDSLGLLFGMGADFNRLLKAATTQDEDFNANLLDAINAAGLMVGYNLVEKTWMSNLGLLLQFAANPEQYGKRFLQQMAGMPIPTIVRHFNDAIDPEQRQMLDIIDYLKMKSGIGRQNLPTAVNIVGDEKKIAQPLGIFGQVEPTDISGKIYDFGVRMVSPYRATDLSKNPLIREMADLGMSTKRVQDEIKFFPDIKADKLTSEQYAYYARAKGSILGVMGNQLLQNVPNWNEIPTAQKKKILGELVAKAGSQAKDLLIQQYEELYKSQAERYIEEQQKIKEPYSEQVFRR